MEEFDCVRDMIVLEMKAVARGSGVKQAHSHVIHELDGGEHGGDEEAVDAVRVHGERGAPAPAAAQEAVEVDVRHHVARGAAPGEPRDARHVRAHRDVRPRRGPERRRRCQRRRGRGRVPGGELIRRRVVALHDALQQRGEDAHHPRRVRQLLLLLGHEYGLLPSLPSRRCVCGCFWRGGQGVDLLMLPS
jgi:hypothetical protein